MFHLVLMATLPIKLHSYRCMRRILSMEALENIQWTTYNLLQGMGKNLSTAESKALRLRIQQ